MFLENKYTKTYLNLMRRAIGRKLTGYVERHHLIPKSIAPQYTLEKANVFTLTAREHFIAHWLLVKMCANEEHKKKMLFALYLMTYGNNRDDKATCGTIYERIRQAYNDSIQGENHPRFGKKHSAETRAKLSANMTGENSHYWGKNLTEATKKKLSLNRMGEKK